jgi:hypothetical protein
MNGDADLYSTEKRESSELSEGDGSCVPRVPRRSRGSCPAIMSRGSLTNNLREGDDWQSFQPLHASCGAFQEEA